MNKILNILGKYVFEEVKYTVKHFFRPIVLIYNYIVQDDTENVYSQKTPSKTSIPN
jgi:hypothetical protein